MKFLSFAVENNILSKKEAQKAASLFKKEGNQETIEYLYSLKIFSKLARIESYFNKDSAQSTIIGVENPFSLLAMKILQDGYLEHDELNKIIDSLRDNQLEPYLLLQQLLKSRLIHLDRFVQLTDFVQHPKALTVADYRVVVEEKRPHFYPTQSQGGLAKSFGHYEILGEIARGGMGVVYKARHQNLDQLYALKVLLPGAELSPKLLDRFRREAVAMAKLQHTGIVQIFDSDFEGEQLYLAMELVRGKTLQDVIRSKPSPYTLRQKIQLILGVAEALHYAHTQGVIHRDLKPGNIFIDVNDQPKIGDFGLAHDLNLSEDTTRLTVSGAILGTPSYMSPEQARGETKTLAPSTDVYSLGVCFYELVTGKVPFSGNLSKLLETIQNEPPPLPHRYVKHLHPDIETIILACLEKEPTKRYQTSQELVLDLKAFLDGSPISRRPPSLFEKATRKVKRHQKEASFLLVLFVLGIVYLGYLYWQKRSQYQHYLAIGDKALKTLHFEEARVAYEKMGVLFRDKTELKKKLGILEEKKEEQLLAKKKESAEELAKQAILIVEQYRSFSKIEALPKLLDSFTLMSEAIFMVPSAMAFREKRNNIAKILIPIACDLKNYQLAIYVANQLKEQEEFQKGLLLYINQAQNQELNHNYQRIKFWRERFENGNVKQGDLKNAKYELIKMNHPKVIARLFSLLESATKYFQGDERAEGKTQFFSLLAEILGHSNQEGIASKLLHILKSLAENERRLSPEKRSSDTFEFMVVLGNSLGVLADPSTEKEFGTLREKLGEEGIFWLRTRLAYSKIPVQVDLKSKDVAGLLEAGIARNRKARAPKYIIPIFKRVLELDPENSLAFLELGKATVRVNKREGYKLFENALLLEPENARYHLALGNAYYVYEDENHKAIESYTKALELDPNLQPAYQRRGKAFSDSNKMEAALKDYNKALELNPLDIYTYVYRGISYKKHSKSKEALNDFSKALIYFPEDDFIYFHRAQTHELMGDERSALDDFSTCIRLNPEGTYLYGDSYSSRGELRLKRGEYAGAIADFSQAIKIDPADNSYWTQRGDARKGLGNITGAMNDYGTALAMVQDKIKKYYPYHVQFFPRRGYIYLKLGKINKAKESFEGYIKKNPEEAMAYYHFACFYALSNNPKPSITALKKALDLGFGHIALLETDDDLKNIRHLKAFKRLVASIKEKDKH